MIKKENKENHHHIKKGKKKLCQSQKYIFLQIKNLSLLFFRKNSVYIFIHKFTIRNEYFRLFVKR